MTNLLLYTESRRTIMNMRRQAADAGHSDPATAVYPHPFPDEIYEELARERADAPSAYDGVLEELFRWHGQSEPALASIPFHSQAVA